MSLQNGSLDSTNALIQLILAQWNPYNVPYTQANNGEGTLTIGIQGTVPNPDLLIQIDEYQPLQSRYQIVFKEGNPRTIYEAPNVYRIEQGIVLELHVRPVRFDPDSTIPKQRLIFEQIKQEVQRILNTYRYDSLFSNTVGGVTTTYASTIEMRGWGQEPLPHGFGRQKEPVEMVSRLGLTIIYYECDGTPVAYIGDRVVSVSCLGNTFTGLVTAEFEDIDPWVMIKIPKGPVIEQNLIGTHVDGKVFVKDWRGLSNCLMTTAIPENSGHYPVNSDGSKTMFSISGNEFSITIRDSSPQPSNIGTKLLTFWFTNVRIKQIKLVKSSAQGGILEPQYEISFMADSVQQPTLN